MNVFLKLKDAEYFNQHIKQHLACKIEKTKVDMWLLDDKKGMQRWASIESKKLEINHLYRAQLA
jgi:hypothetical protein